MDIHPAYIAIASTVLIALLPIVGVVACHVLRAKEENQEA